MPQFFSGTAALHHVGHGDVLDDAPEVARVSVVHLHLDRLRKHLVESPWLGRVHQYTAIAGFAREAVFHLQPVVTVDFVVHQVAAGRTEADQHAVAGHEGHLAVGVLVEVGNVQLSSPTGLSR